MPLDQAFSCGFWGLGSGCQACALSLVLFPTEPSPRDLPSLPLSFPSPPYSLPVPPYSLPSVPPSFLPPLFSLHPSFLASLPFSHLIFRISPWEGGAGTQGCPQPPPKGDGDNCSFLSLLGTGDSLSLSPPPPSVTFPCAMLLLPEEGPSCNYVKAPGDVIRRE